MATSKRRELEKENRKKSILMAAEKVMNENGLHGLNIDLIANETQLAKGTIYLYFKNKEEILAVLTTKARNLLYNDFKKIDKLKVPILLKIKKIIEANLKFSIKHPLYYDLVSLYEANHLLEEQGDLFKSSEEISVLVHGLFTEAKNEDLLRDNLDPIVLTMNLWASTVGTLQMIKVRGKLLKEAFQIEEDILFKSNTIIFINGIINSNVRLPDDFFNL